MPLPFINWRKEPKSIDKYRFVYHFLPHPELNTRASLLSNKALFIYCILLVLIALVFRFVPKVAPGVLGYASNISISDLLKYTNATREQNGRKALRLNPALTEAAQHKAAHMFEHDYWAHVAPDGTEPWSFILNENYDYVYAGENLAKNFSNSKDVVKAWMESPSHKENLLSPNYDEIGFAVVNGVLNGYETTLVVQMFGRPRDMSRIATVETEKSLLESAKSEKVAEEPESQVPVVSGEKRVSFAVSAYSPAIDVPSFTRGISLIFGGFIALLLALDLWYSGQKGIKKFTGHTFFHLSLFVLAIIGIWFLLRPGLIM
jgi:hypothetical protein